MAKLLKNFRTRINEAEARAVVVTFGRFNPPTTGHEKLIKAIEKVATKNNADYRIYPSQSQDPKKNPLSHADKVKFMRKMFRKYSRNIMDDKSVKTMFNVASKAYEDGYRKLIIVVGADQVKEFGNLIPKYNGKDGRHGFYDFEDIQVVSAGNRVDPDSEKAKEMTADSMSASVLRKLAADGHFDEWTDEKGKKQLGFKSGVPDTLGDTDKRVLFNKVRQGMKLAAINEAFAKLFEENVVIVEKAPPDEKLQKWLEDPKTKADFQSRYGDEWEEIMYATAWKIYNDKEGKIQESWNIDEEMDEDFAPVASKKTLGEIRSRLKNDPKPIIKELVEEVQVFKKIPISFAEEVLLEAQSLLYIFEDDDEGRMVKSDLSKMVKQAQELMQLIGDEDDLPGWAQNKFTIAADYINSVHGYLTYSNEAPKLEQFVFEAISKSDLDGVEKYADRLFGKVGIDVEFTRHFLDRVNDARNKKEITVAELIRLFKQTYQKHGKKIAQLGPDAEAVINDMMTDINMPFVLKWDSKSQELDLVSKTVMRKKNFATSNQKFTVEVAQDKDIEDRDGTQPAKYYAGDMAKSTKKKRAAQFDKQAKMDDDDPNAYKPAPGDASAKTKLSKHTKKYQQMFGEDTEDTIKKKSDETGIDYAILKKVFDRGVAAWKSGHRPGTTAVQWGFARINSFATGGKTRTTADADLWAKHSGKSESLDMAFEALEWGSDESVASHKKKTPGEVEEETMAQLIAKISAKTIKKKPYEKAAEIVKKVFDRKKKETGGKLKHSIEYYAGEVLRQTNFGVKLDTRLVAKMAMGEEVAEAIGYSLDNNKPIYDMYRPHSDNYYSIFREARKLELELQGLDKHLIEETDIGKFHIMGDEVVPLDIPLVEEWLDEEKDVELNKPKRGGSKKFYVYVRNDKGNVVKVSFGDTSGLKAKIDDPEARKSFVARHQCDTKKDKTTPGYWACRLPMYAKELGLEGGGDFFW